MKEVSELNSNFENLDLVDLLSERNYLLRNLAEKLWNDHSDIYISNSEWFIMARTYKKQPTIAYISKHVDISRQATHKFIKNLEAKGLVEVQNVENNKKEKCLRLTPLGEDCYEKNEALKSALEKQIEERIGTSHLFILKEILSMNWGLSN